MTLPEVSTTPEKQEEQDVVAVPSAAPPATFANSDSQPIPLAGAVPISSSSIPTTAQHQHQLEQDPPPPTVVQVIAPTQLRGGYQFRVDAPPNGSYLVQVPQGGVSAGQRFDAIVVQDYGGNQGSHSIPSGRWRDGLCDCCTLGCCHPQCCLTFWCHPCALGQVLTRMKLNCLAARYSGGTSAYRIMFILAAVMLVFNFVFNIVIASYQEDDDSEKDDPAFVQALNTLRSAVNVAVFLFLFMVTFRLRQYIRERYAIPESCCNGCEDCCCSFWCGTCTVCQLARHTADYHRYPAACCTETGLEPNAPEVV